MRGRKKLPTQLKVLQGTARKSREQVPGMKEPEPRQTGLRDCPIGFTTLQRKVWETYAKDLHDAGLLRDVDYPQFEAFCIAQATVEETNFQLNRDGLVILGALGTPMKHPAWAIQKDALVLVNKFGSEFGLSPAARGRVKIPEQKPENGLRAFLGKKK